MRKMLLLAIATMGATALLAAPSEARPYHEYRGGEQYREVERKVIVQPIPGVQVQLPVQVVRPEPKRVIVVRERERPHHRYYEHRGWHHHRPHQEVIIVRR
ncbi:hypothetical protein J7643_18335 [bacterium]|nr:hypothetical protein [bacterium]